LQVVARCQSSLAASDHDHLELFAMGLLARPQVRLFVFQEGAARFCEDMSLGLHGVLHLLLMEPGWTPVGIYASADPLMPEHFPTGGNPPVGRASRRMQWRRRER